MLRVLDRHAVGQMLRTKDVDAWGVAANEPRMPLAPEYPTAISILMRLDPLVVHGLRYGPTLDYYQEYLRVNTALDDATDTLVNVLKVHGHAAERVVATGASNGSKPFPHKTAATSAGLGWIGKTALFISPEFGPAVRLTTVFTDLDLPAGEPVVASRCGTCRDCVDACPAGCGRDVVWRAGMARELLFDAGACRHHMTQFTSVKAEICGICIAACPYTLRH
ncbi:MAG TPA: epoxyqueuosine reductase [Thermoleophilia bacterium]|nr:epoxyqueuosine reductase [Thermoleophilia bacterium]